MEQQGTSWWRSDAGAVLALRNLGIGLAAAAVLFSISERPLGFLADDARAISFYLTVVALFAFAVAAVLYRLRPAESVDGGATYLRAPDAPLSEVETAFVAKNYRALKAFGEKATFPASYTGLIVLLVLSTFVVAVVVWFVPLVAHFWLVGEREVLRAQGEAWALQFPAIGMSMLFYAFAAIAFAVLAFQAMARRSPRFNMYLMVQSAFHQKEGKKARGLDLEKALELRVRSGDVPTTRPLDPEQFLSTLSSRRVRYWALVSVAFAALARFCAWFELGSYTMLTPNRIEEAELWSHKVHRYRYSDVKNVSLECGSGRKGKLILGYWMNYGDSYIDLLSTELVDTELSKVEKVDAILRDLRVRFEMPEPDESGQRYSAGCLEKIADRYDAPTARRIRKLLRAEQ